MSLSRSHHVALMMPIMIVLSIGLFVLSKSWAIPRINFALPSARLEKSSHILPQHAGFIWTEFKDMPVLDELPTAGDLPWANKFSSQKGGFLHVRRNESLVEKWGVTVFHSLHCLQMLQDVAFMPEASYMPAMDKQHVLHCLGYLAQVREVLIHLLHLRALYTADFRH